MLDSSAPAESTAGPARASIRESGGGSSRRSSRASRAAGGIPGRARPLEPRARAFQALLARATGERQREQQQQQQTVLIGATRRASHGSRRITSAAEDASDPRRPARAAHDGFWEHPSNARGGAALRAAAIGAYPACRVRRLR